MAGGAGMRYATTYASPLGNMLLAADEVGLTGLWFDGQKYYAAGLDPAYQMRELPVFDAVKRCLDAYFAGREPDFMPPLHLTGTPFQTEVWDIMRQIPYGATTTYGNIARQMASRRGLTHLSAQAVGNAVGRNRVLILVPCHRVIGSDGSLTGYAGGVEKKQALLQLEGVVLQKA